MKDTAKSKHIILFDGECNFCNFWVRHIIKHDKKDVFRFTSLQSEIGKGLLLQHKVDSSIDSILLIEAKTAHIKSTAALRVLKTLGGAKSILYIFIVIPAFIRDFFYDVIAKYRHLLISNRSCELTEDKNFTHKFLM